MNTNIKTGLLSTLLRSHTTLLWSLFALLSLFSSPTWAQSEGGLLLGAEVEKKLGKQWSVGLEGDFRTRNDFKTVDRWSIGAGASYKFTKWLKADAGYVLLNNNFREKIAEGSSRTKWRPSYWGLRHRVHASLVADYKVVGNLRLSLRERWQYTYRAEKSVTRWSLYRNSMTSSLDEDYVRSGKGKNQLRSRLQAEWDKKRALLTPFASIELYNSWSIEKIRYTVGTDIRLNKQHSLSAFYRFQDMRNIDEEDYDPDMHYLGLGYKFKF